MFNADFKKEATIRELLAYLRLWIGIAAVSGISLMGWSVANYKVLPAWVILLIGVVFFPLLFGLIVLNWVALKWIFKMEEAK